MYNLQVLNDKEFEELSKDLIENELRLKFQNFKRGRDGGIDLRHAADVENKIIVQAKHFINSKYSDLKHKLLREEKKKIIALQPRPQRYIVFTSIGLTPQQVDELVDGLNPYLVNSNDVYSLDRILTAIDNYPRVAEKHYKLWLTSTIVLNRILNNSIAGRSEFYAEKIIKRLSLYVPTQNYESAVHKLKENHFVIITGLPGIGKTTISFLLICDFLAQDYELVYITDSIHEAEGVFNDPDKKQVFYFDDFLGANIYDMLNPRNSESSIVSFIERINHSKNKFLILTTRTTILNQAQQNFEKFANSKFSKLSRYEVELSEYSKYDKAKILYNHLYHSNSSYEFIDQLREGKAYMQVIQHRNYSPRIIEFITDRKNFGEIPQSDYLKFITKNLNNPEQVWKSAYENQLSEEERFLLTTLFSFGGYNVDMNILELAFDARVKYEIAENGYALKNNIFKISIQKLLDGFIKSTIDSVGNRISFLNPSIGDFLLNYLKDSKTEKWRLVKSIIYWEQLTCYFLPERTGHIPFKEVEKTDLRLFFKTHSSKIDFFDIQHDTTSRSIEILKLYYLYFPGLEDEDFIEEWFKKIDLYKVKSSQLSSYIDILEKSIASPKHRESILGKLEEIFLKLYDIASRGHDLERIRLMVEGSGIDFFELISRHSEHLVGIVTNCFLGNLSDDGNLSEYETDRVVSAYHQMGEGKAEDIIIDSVSDDYFSFVSLAGFGDFYDAMIDDFQFDSEAILKSIIRAQEKEEDTYFPQFAPNKHRDPRISEDVRIQQLFE